MLADMHMHTEFSLDSCARIDHMADRAIAMGLDMITITDHIDWDFPEPDMLFDFDLDKYYKYIERAKRKYRGRLDIRMGVELGLQPHLSERYETMLKKYPFDLVIGSVHLLYDRDPYYPEAFQGMTDQQAYRVYFEQTLENVRAFHGFDSLGHLDYIVRYGKMKAKNYECSDYMDVIDEILKELVEHNIALEVNSAGLRKNLGFPNPHTDIIKRYKELHGEMITVGADGHKPPHIGYAFSELATILKDCGFAYYTRFKQRKPEFVKI